MFVLTVLEKFGEKLIEMGVPIWKLQADALSKTSYAGDADGASSAAGKEN